MNYTADVSSVRIPINQDDTDSSHRLIPNPKSPSSAKKACKKMTEVIFLIVIISGAIFLTNYFFFSRVERIMENKIDTAENSFKNDLENWFIEIYNNATHPHGASSVNQSRVTRL